MYFNEEILSKAFQHLTPEELIKCRRVNKFFYTLSNKTINALNWKHYLQSKFAIMPEFFNQAIFTEFKLCFKTLYFKLSRIRHRDILTLPSFAQINLATIHLLAIYGNETLLKYFVKYSPNSLHLLDNADRSVFDYAALGSNEACFKFLSEGKFDNWDNTTLPKNVLNLAVVGGNIELVKFLIDNKKISLQERDKLDRTPLLLACACSDYEMAKFLIEQKHNFSANELCKITHLNALQYAAMRGNYELFLLLDSRFKFDYKHTDKDGRNVLHFAHTSRNEKIVKKIRDMIGKDLDIKDRHGCLPADYPRTVKRNAFVKHSSYTYGEHSKYRLQSKISTVGSKSF